ncbi:sterol desaturase family protein [Nannocystis pusilla]|uniref:Sterol desaturase family protein n=1 Tax=Nannocystis pusilla TaxID=889268 RepID=A0ABS7THD8_9BACT|nr:sterol desaturase family protein [Nannocystis pusilla]MBZ5707635.1 sterol desaturase family protein [Nannocystis pusilla]
MTTHEHEPLGGKNPTLGQAARAFFTFHSPRIFAVVLPLLVATRVAVGGFGWSDLLVVPILLAVQPFAEWLIHVYILHFKPTRVFGRTFDLQIAKFHRAHHRDPWRLELVFIPRRAGWLGLAMFSAVWFLLAPTPQMALSGVVGSVVVAFLYEWTHYLTHTGYKPQSEFYRRIWRYHRLHHFKNEHYWQGVTTHLGDRILGTMPDHAGVPNSPTCRTLGIEAPTDLPGPP